MQNVDLEKVGEVLENARRSAIRYRELTGKPLGITGEVGEFEAARLLHLALADARQKGFDASDGMVKYQIKTRLITEAGRKKSQKASSISLKHEWDKLLLVLLDDDFKPTKIFEADRKSIETELAIPGSKARNERGALPVGTICRIGRERWPNDCRE